MPLRMEAVIKYLSDYRPYYIKPRIYKSKFGWTLAFPVRASSRTQYLTGSSFEQAANWLPKVLKYLELEGR